MEKRLVTSGEELILSIFKVVWQNLTKNPIRNIRKLITQRREIEIIAYKKEKLENAICFFASEHKMLSKKPLA